MHTNDPNEFRFLSKILRHLESFYYVHYMSYFCSFGKKTNKLSDTFFPYEVFIYFYNFCLHSILIILWIFTANTTAVYRSEYHIWGWTLITIIQLSWYTPLETPSRPPLIPGMIHVCDEYFLIELNELHTLI